MIINCMEPPGDLIWCELLHYFKFNLTEIYEESMSYDNEDLLLLCASFSMIDG